MSSKTDLEKELEKVKRQLQLEKCKTNRLKNSIQKKVEKTKQKAEREKDKLKEALVSAIYLTAAEDGKPRFIRPIHYIAVLGVGLGYVSERLRLQ